MRIIPSEILERIRKLNQTIYENAAPSMEVTLERVAESLGAVVFGEGQRGRVDIAGRREDPDQETSELVAITTQDGQGVVYKSLIISREYGALMTPRFILGPAQDVAVVFDGAWTLNSAGDLVFVSEGEPHYFRLHNGIVYHQHGRDGRENVVASRIGNNARIAALRGWKTKADIAGEHEAEFTVTDDDEPANELEDVTVAVTAGHNVGFTVTDDDEPANEIEDVELAITQLGSRDQGILVAYTREGGAYYRRWLSHGGGWSREIAADLLPEINNVDIFRAGNGQAGIIGERAGTAHLAWTEVPDEAGATEDWSGVEGKYAQQLIPAVIGSMIEAEAPAGGKDIRLVYTRAGNMVLITTFEHEDYQGLTADEVRTLLYSAGIQHIKARVLYEAAVWIAWNDLAGFKVGRVRPPIIDVETLSAGNITLELDNPVARVELSLEAVPPRLPAPRLPTWDDNVLKWDPIDPEEPLVIPRDVSFTVEDPGEQPLEDVEIEVTQLY